MTRFKFGPRSWLVATFLIGAIVATSAQASITVGDDVFLEDFNGPTLDSNVWDVVIENNGSMTFDGNGLATVLTASSDDNWYATSLGTLDFSSSPDEWGVEITFQVNGEYSSSATRQYSLLSGLSTSTASGWTTQGFDLRLLPRPGEDRFNLAWYGWDNDDSSRSAITLETGYPTSVPHVAQLHRKTDGTVDIYVDGTLLVTSPQALINGVNPTQLRFGDASSYIEGNVVYDQIKISTVPEPSTVMLVITGILGMLFCGWRKKNS